MSTTKQPRVAIDREILLTELRKGPINSQSGESLGLKTKLGERIFELRKQGYNIKTRVYYSLEGDE